MRSECSLIFYVKKFVAFLKQAAIEHMIVFMDYDGTYHVGKAVSFHYVAVCNKNIYSNYHAINHYQPKKAYQVLHVLSNSTQLCTICFNLENRMKLALIKEKQDKTTEAFQKSIESANKIMR
jgi:hypothetical protein